MRLLSLQKLGQNQNLYINLLNTTKSNYLYLIPLFNSVQELKQSGILRVDYKNWHFKTFITQKKN